MRVLLAHPSGLKYSEILLRLEPLGPERVAEALDEEGLKAFRKRTTPAVNNKALEVARSIGLTVAINIIADPDWDEARFALVRECTSTLRPAAGRKLGPGGRWSRVLLSAAEYRSREIIVGPNGRRGTAS